MIATCGAITPEELVGYWASDLPAGDVDRLDGHLMGCATCSAASARIAAVAGAMRSIIPPFLDHATLDSLRTRGHRIRENPLRPDVRRPVVFEATTDLLIHKLAGLDLRNAASVGVVLSVEETGDVLIDEPHVPFDRDSGEVLIACQRHFAALPPNIVAKVSVRDSTGAERQERFPIPHLFEPRE
jgi:hypothetical protein